jgi:hypothetical protein
LLCAVGPPAASCTFAEAGAAADWPSAAATHSTEERPDKRRKVRFIV